MTPSHRYRKSPWCKSTRLDYLYKFHRKTDKSLYFMKDIDRSLFKLKLVSVSLEMNVL